LGRSLTTIEPICFSFILVDLAVKTAHKALFTHAGQVCFAAFRLFVHSKIHDQFVAKSVELAKKRVVGDPFDSKTEQGPQVQ
jgi:aldehyde dehydrogenase (NAD+)